MISPIRRFAVFLTLALAVGGGAVAQPPGAATPTSLNPYEGRVPVADQSGPNRDRALQQALAQVIDRVSGDGAAATAPALVTRAPQLVQRYGYETDPASRQLQLVASFDARTIESQLRGLGLTVWGVSAAPVEDVRLSIAGIRSAQDYARLLTRLRGLPGVRNVQVASVQGDLLQLRLRAEGGAQRLSGALYAGGGLMPDTPAAGAELGYRLR
ncbi:MAG TPA: DUF2066 domain-containing protein [Solimonas sp.]